MTVCLRSHFDGDCSMDADDICRPCALPPVWEWDEWPGDTLVLIACSGRKNDTHGCSIAAGHLYTGSLFTMALGAARTMVPDKWIRIVSARHGFLKLDQMIRPYEQRLGDRGEVKDAALLDQVRWMRMLLDGNDFGAVVSFMPHAYTERIRPFFEDMVDVMEGVRGVGEIRHRLNLVMQLRDETGDGWDQ